MALFAYSFRSFLARRGTAAAAVLGISALVFTLAGTLMLLSGVRRALERQGDPSVAVVVSTGSTSETESNWGMPQAATIAAERGSKGPRSHAEEIVTLLDLPRRDGSLVTTAVRGIAPGWEGFRPRFRIAEGRMLNPGAGEMVMGRRMKSRLAGAAIGAEIEFRRNHRAKVVGFFEDDDSFYESELWVDRDFLQRMFGREGFLSSQRLRLDSPGAVASLREALEHDKRLGVRVYDEPEFLKKQGAVAGGLVTGLGAVVSSLIGLGASLGVAMTMFGMVSQRRRELGVLRALGFTRAQVLGSLLAEALLFGSAAAVLGSLAAVLGLSSVDFSLAGGAGEEVSFKFDAGPAPVLAASLAAIVLCVISGVLPALRASRVPPTAAMRG